MSAKNRYQLAAQPRDRAGKGVARALRREHQIPAVIYGDNKEPVTISLPEKEITKAYYQGGIFTKLCEMQVGNDKHLLLARDVQTHPVQDRILHVDFLRVTEKTKIAVDIPVHFINEDQSPGMRDEKGILNVVRYSVELLCSATKIPEYVEMDLTGLEIGGALKMSNIKLPEGVRPVIEDRDPTIATLVAPKTVEEEEAEAAEGEEGEEGEAAEGEEGEGAAKEGSADEGAEKAESDEG